MKNWPLKPLGEVAELIGGSTPSRNTPRFWDGDIHWLTPTDMPATDSGVSVVTRTKERITQDGLDNSSATIVPKGTVLFSSRATIGKVAVAGVPLATNQGFANFVPHSEISSRFLAYSLWFRREDIARLSGSTTFKEVSRSTLRKYQVPVPPLPEQARIVKLLDEADALRKLRAEADTRTTALIPALFDEMFGNPERNPKKWPVKNIAEIAVDGKRGVTTGPFGTSLGSKDFIDEGPEVFGIYSLRDGNGFRAGGSKHISEQKYTELRRYDVTPGDVLISRMGTVGKVCIVPATAPKGIVSYHLIRLRLSPQHCDPEFTAQYLSVTEKAGVGLSKFGKGAVMSGINATIVASFPNLLPPLPLQKEFAARVTELRALEASQAANHTRLEELFQSMLHRAFRGEL